MQQGISRVRRNDCYSRADIARAFDALRREESANKRCDWLFIPLAALLDGIVIGIWIAGIF